MKKIINVTIRDKIAKNFREWEPEYICGNSDFIVEFDFDEEWDEFYGKTARFVYNDTHQDVVFTGSQCEIPEIENTHMIKVGVYAGNLKTTTPAIIMAKKSILCGSGVPAAPADDVYMQILKMLSDCVEGSEGATFTPIATEVEDGVELSWENDKEMPNPEPVKIFNGADGKDGKDGKDGYTPVKGVDYFDGQPGVDGSNGVDGYTPVKGVDYFDGKDGSNGQPGSDGRDGVDGITPHIGQNGNWYIGETDTGKPSQGNPGKDGSDGNNGVSVSHVWEGTVLKVTSASGTSSADLKGEKGNPGAAGKDGYTPVKGVDYFDGKNGSDGYTPVKGVDYFDGKDGQDGTSVTVKSVSESITDDGNNVVIFSDGKTLKIKNGSKGSTGTTGKTAYEYAKDGGYAGTEAQFAAKLAAEFPTKLPNPNGIHINGEYYDGSQPVTVNIEGGSGNADMGASGGELGYVKRREFYDEPDKTVADNVSVSNGQYSWISYDIVADHKAATIIYDGVTYECPINFKESISPDYGDESYFYIGNWNNSAPEYPFSIFGYRTNDFASVSVGSGTHTISVTLKAMLKKIDKKFLPDDIGGETTTKTLFYERDSDADGGIDDYGYIPALEAGVTYEVEWGGEVYTDTAKKVIDVFGVSQDDTVVLPDGTEYQPGNDVAWGDLSYFTGGNQTMPIRMEYMEGGSTMLFNMTGVAGVRHVKIYVVEKASSGVSSWNDLTDRPFGTETITVDPTFDGDMTGKETIVVNDGTYAVKLSPQYVPASEMIGATMVLNYGGTEMTIPLTAETVLDGEVVLGMPGAIVLMEGQFVAFSVPTDTTLEGITLTPGTWVMYAEGMLLVKSLSCLTPGEYEVVKKIDPKYLPKMDYDFGNFTLTAYEEPFQVGKSRLTMLGADVLAQMEKGILSIKFDYLNSAGTETKAFKATMLPMGELEWYGFCRDEEIVYMVNMAPLDGQNMMLCQLAINPMFVRGGSSANELNPVAFNVFTPYAISVDDNGNVVAKELTI